MNVVSHTSLDRRLVFRRVSLVAIVAIALSPLALVLRGVPDAHDLPDHVAMAEQFRAGLAEGRWYPRWFGAFNFGLGEPTGVYYPPALSASTAAASAITGDTVTGLFGALALFAVIGGLGVYRFAARLGGTACGVVAAVVWTLLPFRYFMLFGAGLYSAFAAGCLLPWLLNAAVSLAAASQRRDTLRHGTVFALIYAAIVLTNLPGALFTTYVIALWTAGLALARLAPWPVLRVGAAGVLGVGLAAVYLLPAVVEMGSIVVPHSGGEPLFLSNFVFQGEGSWMAPGLKSIFTRMGLAVAAVGGSGLTLLAVCRFWGRVRESGEAGKPARSLGVSLAATCFGVGLFLATPLSRLLWQWVPLLEHVQLPWRLLDVIAAPAAALLALGLTAFDAATASTSRRRARIAVVAAATLAAIPVVQLDLGLAGMNGTVGSARGEQVAAQFYGRPGYFQPRGAADPRALVEAPAVEVDTAAAHVEVVEDSVSRRLLSVRSSEPARLVLRTYSFPGWRAWRVEPDGARRPLRTLTEPRTGLLAIAVPPGVHRVEISFENTPVRSAAAWLSGLAAGLVLVTFGASLLRRRYRDEIATECVEARPEAPAAPRPKEADETVLI